ncbi:TAR DNA-binding protein 43, partial [Armadillidium vulgare]
MIDKFNFNDAFVSLGKYKRKSDKLSESSSSKTKRLENFKKYSDLIALRLPWRTTEKELREYFEPYGEVLKAQVKKDSQTGQSKGFDFIHFQSYEVQQRVLGQRHMID